MRPTRGWDRGPAVRSDRGRRHILRRCRRVRRVCRAGVQARNDCGDENRIASDHGVVLLVPIRFQFLCGHTSSTEARSIPRHSAATGRGGRIMNRQRAVARSRPTGWSLGAIKPRHGGTSAAQPRPSVGQQVPSWADRVRLPQKTLMNPHICWLSVRGRMAPAFAVTITDRSLDCAQSTS